MSNVILFFSVSDNVVVFFIFYPKSGNDSDNVSMFWSNCLKLEIKKSNEGNENDIIRWKHRRIGLVAT